MSYGKSGLKDCADMGAATSLAEKARKASSGAFHGGMPPSGPKKEPVLTNDAPKIKESGVSKK